MFFHSCCEIKLSAIHTYIKGFLTTFQSCEGLVPCGVFQRMNFDLLSFHVFAVVEIKYNYIYLVNITTAYVVVSRSDGLHFHILESVC